MHFRPKKRVKASGYPLPAILLCVSSLASPLGYADGHPDSLFDLSIKDLMVTKVTSASLFEESEIDAASSVSVLEATQWEKTGARRLSDALESVPSVATYPTWGGAEAIAIRGYATELSVRGLANTLDGVPLNTYSFATSLYDKPEINLAHLERVEVIRGPGSTLYGSDAFHGVISRQLKQSETDTVSASVTASDSDYEDASLFVSQGFSKTRINAGAAISRQTDQNLPYQYTSPSDGLTYASARDYEYKDLSAFATLHYDASEATRFKFTTYINDFESDEFPGTGTQFFARLPATFDLQSISLTEDKEHSSQTSDFWMTALDVAQDIGTDLTLEAKLYHWQSTQQWVFDNERYPTSLTLSSNPNVSLPCRNATNNSPNPIYCPHELFQSTDEHRSGLHLFVKSKKELYNTQWALGFGRDRFKVDDTRFSRIALDGSVVLLDQSNPYLGSKRHVDFALFQARTNFLNKRMQLIYGLRADAYSDLDSHLSPRLGAVYQVAENYTTKLLYGHAFRAPTAIERLGSVQGVEANPDIEPEVIDTLEWVNVFYDKHYTLEATVFGNRWKEGIVLVPSAPPLNKYVNTGRNESYGVELSGTQRFEQLRLRGSGSFVKSKNEETSTDYLAFPKWLFTLEGAYQFADSGIELVAKERVMLDYAEGDYLGTRRPPSADNYYRTDISVMKHLHSLMPDGEHTLALHVYNVFDRDNVVPSLYNAEGGLSDRGISFALAWDVRW